MSLHVDIDLAVAYIDVDSIDRVQQVLSPLVSSIHPLDRGRVVRTDIDINHRFSIDWGDGVWGGITTGEANGYG
ncbi:MAG: hypothetical protein H6821_16660 [Planctomycetaceae bacterium]|nr:hypothetical protein [Planctomycetales bacterium]MCB9875804.1 hypothetical protein [Planctomycetaceae bacterium]MCB9940651.1 hypothetical protein [Planctomycetaceae bacterium]